MKTMKVAAQTTTMHGHNLPELALTNEAPEIPVSHKHKLKPRLRGKGVAYIVFIPEDVGTYIFA